MSPGSFVISPSKVKCIVKCKIMKKKLFIGIDFSKETFDASLFHAEGLEKSGEVTHECFDNNKPGYRKLYSWVRSLSEKVDPGAWLFCGENTGVYGEGLSEWLSGKGLDIWIEMPYAIKHSMGLVRGKSDKADSLLIAEYAWRHQDKAVPYEPLKPALRSLREVVLMRQQLVRERAAHMVRKQGKDISTPSEGLSFIRGISKRVIAALDKEIEKCDKEIDQIIDSDPELHDNYVIVTSVKGIGRQNGAVLLVYTNNFTKFNLDARKMACYYGIAPFAKESGTSLHTPAHTSHMANKTIKAILGQAALAACRFNPSIGLYYQRLIERGKNHQVALNNVKNKLLHIIVALVKNRQIYDEYYSSHYADKEEVLNMEGKTTAMLIQC